jgi:hypothetical protein
MKDDNQDTRKGYAALATDNDSRVFETLSPDGDEAIDAEEREKRLAVTALRRSYIVRKKMS